MFAKTFEYIILLLCLVNCYVFKTDRCKNSDAILSCFLAFKIITNILPVVVGITSQDFLFHFQLLTISAILGTKLTVVVRDLSKIHSCWEMEHLRWIVVADLIMEIT